MKKRKVPKLEKQFREISIIQKHKNSTSYLCVHIPTGIELTIEKYSYTWPISEKLSKDISFQVLNRKIFASISTIQNTYHFIRDQTHTWFFSESVKGETIVQLLSHGPLSFHLIRYLFFLMVQTVLQIHNKGLCIRNWNPDNFRISNSMIKFIGLNDVVPLNEVKNDSILDWLGTISWMAPEMLLDNEYSIQETDIWCLGLFLYYLIKGECLIKPENAFFQLTNFEFKPDDNFSDIINDLLSKMLLKDPHSRITARAILSHPFLKPSIPFPITSLPINITSDVEQWLLYLHAKPEKAHSEMMLYGLTEGSLLYHLAMDAVAQGRTVDNFVEEEDVPQPHYIFPDDLPDNLFSISNEIFTNNDKEINNKNQGKNQKSADIHKLLSFCRTRMEERGINVQKIVNEKKRHNSPFSSTNSL